MKKQVNKPAENHYDLSQPEVKALWDAAYAKGVKDGTIISEERIIKLLEETKYHFSVYAPRFSTEEPRIECHSECLCCHFIALIKGEK